MTDRKLIPEIRLVEPQARTELRLEADGIHWCGPADPDLDSPWLLWRLATGGHPALAKALHEGDCLTIGTYLAPLPVATGALLDLARHCQHLQPALALQAASGAMDTDLRWRQALAEACLASGQGNPSAPAATPQPVAEAPPQQPFTHLRYLPGNRLATLAQSDRITGPTVEARLSLTGGSDPGRTIDFAGTGPFTFGLPTPVGETTEGIAVTAFDASQSRGAVWIFHPDGSLISHGCGLLSTHPQAFTLAGSTVWLHGQSEHIQWRLTTGGNESRYEVPTAIPGTALHQTQRAPGQIDRRVTLCDGWMLALPSFQMAPAGRVFTDLVWVDLSGERPDRPVPWGQDVWRIEPEGDRVWIASMAGVVSVGADHPPVTRFAEPAYGLALDADVAYIGTRSGNEVVCLERSTGATFWRTPIDHGAYTLFPVPGGVIACNTNRWTWLSDDGQVRLTSDERRDVGFARLADGTSAISAGEDVLVLDPDGKLARRIMLPYDGGIVGATARHFLFGPADGGIDRITPDGFHVISNAGDVVATLPFANQGSQPRLARVTYGGGSSRDSGLIGETGVWLCPYPGNQLLYWDLTSDTAPAGPQLATIPRLPARRGETVVKWETINPRDDWAEPGLTVARANLLASGSVYGGTTGVSPAPAILVSDGATATFHQCRFTAGGGKLQRHATVFLIGCELNWADWELEEGCHLVLLDCQIPESVHFCRAASATLTAPGFEAASDQWPGAVQLRRSSDHEES